jgi:hypothetical protein
MGEGKGGGALGLQRCEVKLVGWSIRAMRGGGQRSVASLSSPAAMAAGAGWRARAGVYPFYRQGRRGEWSGSCPRRLGVSSFAPRRMDGIGNGDGDTQGLAGVVALSSVVRGVWCASARLAGMSRSKPGGGLGQFGWGLPFPRRRCSDGSL